MTKVLLINQDKIPHYRIPVYNYLSEYLEKEQIALIVASGGAQYGNPHGIKFRFSEISMSFFGLARLILEENPEAIIFWVDFKYLYLFPILMLTKLLRKRAIYWGHGCDLTNKNSRLQKIANAIQYWMDDAIILYGEHLKKYVSSRFHNKVFIANNTLNMAFNHFPLSNKKFILSKYGINTQRNIICMGRMEKRKGLEDLFKAHEIIGRRDVGLILVGPDNDGILQAFCGDNIYKLDAIYSDERLELLCAADVYCLPGWVGLSIVDAFYCGLPFVTEDGENAPEIMYLKDGINGFIVPKGDVEQLAKKLQLLLEDDSMREQFSREARKEIMTNGHIDKMSKGFNEALKFVCNLH